MSVVESGRLGDRLSVGPARRPMSAMTLYLTIVYFRGGTVYLTVYRLRIILGSRRGWFDVVELSHSRSSCIPALGRPSSWPEEPIHGSGRERVGPANLLSSKLPVRRVLTPAHCLVQVALPWGSQVW